MDPIGYTYSVNSIRTGYPAEGSINADRRKGAASSATEATPSNQTANADTVSINNGTARQAETDNSTYNADGRINDTAGSGSKASAAQDQTSASTGQTDQDPQVQQQIARLKATEEKVKAHEAAHKTAGGAATGPVSYTYTRGPDGRNYITGGEVPITISTGSTPRETISRMDTVIRAALAPSDPSPQDRAVAAQATSIKQQAQQEMSQQSNPLNSTEERPGSEDAAGNTADTGSNVGNSSTQQLVGVTPDGQGIRAADATYTNQSAASLLAAENSAAKPISIFA